MKKIIGLIVIISFALTSCSNRKVTIVDKNGVYHTAIIAPVKYCDMPVDSERITIFKPVGGISGWLHKDYIYNDVHFSSTDTIVSSGFGLFKHSVIRGNVVKVEG